MKDYLNRIDFISAVNEMENINSANVDKKIQLLLDKTQKLGTEQLQNDLLEIIEMIKMDSFVQGIKTGTKLKNILE